LAGVSNAIGVAAVILIAATSDAFGSSRYSGPGVRRCLPDGVRRAMHLTRASAIVDRP
jgi:hypothetical protein